MAKIKKLRIILPEEKDDATDVVAYGKRVKEGMTANVSIFPDPTIKLPEFEAAYTALENSIVTGLNQSGTTDNNTKNLKLAFLALLSTQSTYVLMIANSDRSKVELSGFTPNKEETATRPTGELVIKYTKVGDADGSVIIRLIGRAGYEMFMVERKVEDKWVPVWGYTNVLFTVTGLPAGSSIIRITGLKGDVKGKSIETVVKAT